VFKVQKWLQPWLLGEEHQVLALRTVFLNNKKVYLVKWLHYPHMLTTENNLMFYFFLK
jgi:hypothetical protein